ncbi:ABC transporter permease [Desulfitibacter alkalitolerans]|uniref:ABC transporter permease n=1 Tax=Desulfitibacter alkalitolerans TaxID=264641 RepID=UPI000481B944|nr:FtsX-like permease family protein [Desulfitibacter alkalitolerans]
MSLINIALANLKVRKIKYMFLMLGMLIGTATIVALFSITAAMESELKEHFDRVGTRVIITQDQERFSLSYRGITVAEDIGKEPDLFPAEKLYTMSYLPSWDQVETIAPKLVASGTTAEGDSLLVLGIDFAEEINVKNYWQVTGAYPNSENQALLGLQLAQRLELEVGDTLVIFDEEFHVAGILDELGSQEDYLLYLSLDKLQRATNNEGLLSMAEVVIPGSQGAETADFLVNELRQKDIGLAGTRVQDAAEGRRVIVEHFARIAFMVTVVIIVIGSLIMGTTMMSSVKERTWEIGIFRAYGFRKKHIMSIIFYEAGILSAMAGAGGYLIGMIIVVFAAPIIADIQGNITWSPVVGLWVLVLTVMVGVMASVYPAVRAANLDPVKALNYL